MKHGLSGTTGDLGGHELLEALGSLRCSGTLVLTQESGALLVLLDHGKRVASHRLGRFADATARQIGFHFVPHPPASTPQLPSRFPGSSVSLLRALPVFAPAQRLEPGSCDLRALLATLRARTFSGSLALAHGSESGLALFLEGVVCAAAYQRDDYLLDRSDALRAIFRYSLDTDRPAMELQPLPPPLARDLLGMALGKRATNPNLGAYSGLYPNESGYSYYHQGNAYLQVISELVGASERFAPADVVPDLHLPDDPPGWEQQRYRLTLRGHDALNPMTELAMAFNSSYGSSGRRILEVLERGLSIEEAAVTLEIDLQQLKPWLERLEQEGLIRPRVAEPSHHP